MVALQRDCGMCVFTVTVRLRVCDRNYAASSVKLVFFLERIFSGSVYCSRAVAGASLQLTDICHPLPAAQRLDQSQADGKFESGCR